MTGAEALVVRLEPEQLAELAAMVAERLGAVRPPEVISAAELARRLGMSREWIYDHAQALGGLRVGDGPRPRLLFPWPTALDGLTSRSVAMRSPERQSPGATAVRARRPRRPLGTSPDLLPIRGESGSSRRSEARS